MKDQKLKMKQINHRPQSLNTNRDQSSILTFWQQFPTGAMRRYIPWRTRPARPRHYPWRPPSFQRPRRVTVAARKASSQGHRASPSPQSWARNEQQSRLQLRTTLLWTLNSGDLTYELLWTLFNTVSRLSRCCRPFEPGSWPLNWVFFKIVFCFSISGWRNHALPSTVCQYWRQVSWGAVFFFYLIRGATSSMPRLKIVCWFMQMTLIYAEVGETYSRDINKRM